MPMVMPMSAEPILSVKDLSVAVRSALGWKTVVDKVSFEVAERQTFALVGESGSGKSVTALSIMGLMPANAALVTGQAVMDGRNLVDLPEAEMTRLRGDRIAMIFQEPMSALNPVMTVGRQIAEPLIRHRGLSRTAARAEALRLMDRVRIPSPGVRAASYPHELSGGMLQRVMIASALACAPKLLIADEPTTALDVTIQAQILELIRELQREDGMSVLFITHDMGVVAELAERTVVMFRSRVIEEGATEDIFHRPQNDYTRRLLASAPRLGSLGASALPLPYADVDVDDASTPAEAVDTIRHDLPPQVEVRNLSVRFDLRKGIFGRVHARVHAVEDVSFDIRQGETLSLVGESGCGKSTTGRALLRLAQPVGGQIRIDGQDIHALPHAALTQARRKMQMIFQDPFSSLNPRMRIGDAIAEPMLAHDLIPAAQAPAEVARLLRQVGLSPEMASRWPHEFSGGQRQRIAIARALAVEPKFIVADESVSALDVTIKAQIVNLMMQLQRDLGLTYLFISHDMAVVERISHRVAVMYLGEIVEIGPRAAIFGNPGHAYTRRLLDAVPEPDPARRLAPRAVAAGEVRTPIRPADYVVPSRHIQQVGPDHFVLQDGAA